MNRMNDYSEKPRQVVCSLTWPDVLHRGGGSENAWRFVVYLQVYLQQTPNKQKELGTELFCCLNAIQSQSHSFCSQNVLNQSINQSGW